MVNYVLLCMLVDYFVLMNGMYRIIVCDVWNF